MIKVKEQDILQNYQTLKKRESKKDKLESDVEEKEEEKIKTKSK